MIPHVIANAVGIAEKYMRDHITTLVNIYRHQTEAGAESVSDGAGGVLLSETPDQDQRTLFLENIPVRMTVPRANRQASEYIKDSSTNSETRVEMIFRANFDIQARDRVDVTINSVVRQFEVQVVSPHSDEISRHATCVEIRG